MDTLRWTLAYRDICDRLTFHGDKVILECIAHKGFTVCGAIVTDGAYPAWYVLRATTQAGHEVMGARAPTLSSALISLFVQTTQCHRPGMQLSA